MCPQSVFLMCFDIHEKHNDFGISCTGKVQHIWENQLGQCTEEIIVGNLGQMLWSQSMNTLKVRHQHGTASAASHPGPGRAWQP